MINLYSGTPGSGKSLHVATTIYWRLRRGLPVIANFDIATEKIPKCDKNNFVYWENVKMKPEKLLAFSHQYFSSRSFKEDRILLVIDECQLVFNAREWDAQGRKAWLSFFSQHRHYGFEVILIAQFDRMVDRQIRSLIEYNFVHRKVSNFGLPGKIMSLLSGGKLFVAVKVWYPLNEKVGSDFFKATKKYYGLYDSYQHFDEAETPVAEPAPKPEPRQKRKPASVEPVPASVIERAEKTEIEQNKSIVEPKPLVYDIDDILKEYGFTG